LKLLTKTGGDLNAVAEYLSAKEALREATKRTKSIQKAVEKEEKATRKLEKKEAKFAKKLSKHERKEHKEKRDHKRKKEDNHPKIEVLELDGKESLPPTVNHIILDGNNMLYVANAIRKYCLKRKSLAEAILSSFAKKYKEISGFKVTIIFDECDKTFDENGFAVFRARPGFPTADDALVKFAESVEDKKSVLFVTSDRELLLRLKGCNVLVSKPKNWMTFASKRIQEIEGREDLSLETYLEGLIRENHPEMITSPAPQYEEKKND